MPKVALIYPYFRTRAQTELLFTPLGIASLASQLQEIGIEAKVFDCTFSTFEGFQESLRAYQPDIIGIYSMITLSRNTFKIAEMVRTILPEGLLVAGGPLPTLYPERFTPAFDVVFRGEADLSFPHFCQDFFDQKGTPRQKLAALPLEIYPGLYIQQGNLQSNNPTVHYSERLINTFPLPYRGDFDHAAYHEAGMLKDGAKTTSIITTYGCSFDCDFCSKPVFGNRFRRRYPDEVFKEIDQIRQLGYDTLWIADDNFTLDLNYLKEFCRRMNGGNLKWTCLSRVTGITLEIAQMMKAAGCHRVYLGLESGSQSTLKLMNKRATLQEGIDAVHLFREAGIEVGAFFIVGYPGETVESIEETFRFALELPLSEISFNVPFPLPGSHLFDRVSELDSSKDWNTENEVTFVYNSEFDEGWLRKRIEETMHAFAEKNKPPVNVIQ